MSVDEQAKRVPGGVLALRTLTMPRDTNPHGDIFGGWILSQMDIAGGLMSSEVSKGRTVTVSVMVSVPPSSSASVISTV